MKSMVKLSMMVAVVAAGLAFFGSQSAEAGRRRVVVRHRGVAVHAPRVSVYTGRGVDVRVGRGVDVQVGGGRGVYVDVPFYRYRPYVRYYHP